MIFRNLSIGGVLFTALLLSSASPVPAYSGMEGTIVTAEESAPLPFAAVRVLGTNRGAVSDDQGHYSIQDLKSGTYRIEVSHVSFRTVIREIALAEEPGREVNFALELLPHLAGKVVINSLSDELQQDIELDKGYVGEKKLREVG